MAAALPALAHHALSAEFDSTKKVNMEGVVTRIEWMNPHAWLHVDVTNAAGQVERWQFEFGAPVELLRRGWRKQDLKVGDRVSIGGVLAKYREFTANAQSIVLPNGARVFSGSAERPAGVE